MRVRVGVGVRVRVRVGFPSTCAQRMTARMMSRCAASEAGMPSLRARATMPTASRLSMNSHTPSEARMRKRSRGAIVRELVAGVQRKPHLVRVGVRVRARGRVRVRARVRVRVRVRVN